MSRKGGLDQTLSIIEESNMTRSDCESTIYLASFDIPSQTSLSSHLAASFHPNMPRLCVSSAKLKPRPWRHFRMYGDSDNSEAWMRFIALSELKVNRTA